MPIFNIIAFLTDNGQGLCRLSVVKWMALLKRSRECIIDNLKGLENDRLILVYRCNGMPNSYTITYPVGLAEIGPNVTQIINAFLEPAKPRSWTNVSEAIADATNRSTLPDRSSLPDRSTLTPEPVYFKPATGLVESSSISSNHIFSPSRGGADTPAKPNGKAEMAAALGGQPAYANRNIIIADSGKISIGEEFRAELREAFTDSQIERGLERAPAQVSGRDPVKLLAQIRRCCSYAKQDDVKAAAKGQSQSAKRTFQR